MTKKRIQFLQNISKLISVAKRVLDIDLLCFSFHRSAEVQKEMVEKGLSQIRHSSHQDWLAMDLVIVREGKAVWEFVDEYTMLGSLWENAFDGVWGGRWEKPVDPYHFQYGDGNA